MATYSGQKGFWAKRTDDANPIWISVGGMDVADSEVEKWKKEWQGRESVQWVGDDPATIYTDIASGNVKAFSKATPDVVQDTYLDELFSEVEERSRTAREQTTADYNLLAQQMKDSRELWNKDLEKTYGRALEKANVNIYARGVQDSGIKGAEISDIGQDKAFSEEQKNLEETMSKQKAKLGYEQTLQNISQTEKSNKLTYKSPYADYSYS